MSQSQIFTLAAINLDSAGTAQRISSSSIVCQSIAIHPAAANSGTIYIGDSNVSSTRYFAKIDPGGLPAVIVGDAVANGGAGDLDLRDLYFDGSNTGDDIVVGYQARSS